MQITKGKINRAQRVVIYGPEGIGKSTLASLWPNPLFMDVESGTSELDVARTPTPASFEMVKRNATDLISDPMGYCTLVVDTADWTERLAITEVCALNNLSGLGGGDDYGRSYNLLEKLWAKWLDSLTELCFKKGIHIVILAHSTTRKFEQPEEIGAYDRWEMKLEKKTKALLKEWPDMLLFYSYKTLVVADGKSKTKKGTGGQRVIRTEHHPCWDAKNRHGLPSEIMVDSENKTKLPTELAQIFYGQQVAVTPVAAEPAPTINGVPFIYNTPMDSGPDDILIGNLPALPTNLIQLMNDSGVTEAEIRKAVGSRGHYPEETPITGYTPEFIEATLVANWDKVVGLIEQQRKVKS